jgi:hypothetical protein
MLSQRNLGLIVASLSVLYSPLPFCLLLQLDYNLCRIRSVLINNRSITVTKNIAVYKAFFMSKVNPYQGTHQKHLWFYSSPTAPFGASKPNSGRLSIVKLTSDNNSSLYGCRSINLIFDR